MSLPSAGPVPEGVNTSVWAFARFQCPGTFGESFGRASPRTFVTGSESVRRSWSPGSSLLPVLG